MRGGAGIERRGLEPVSPGDPDGTSVMKGWFASGTSGVSLVVEDRTMWNLDHKSSGAGSFGDRNGQEPTDRRLIGVALVVALALFVASSMPAALVAPVLKELLFYGAFGAIIAAAIRRETLFADRMTGWDQAAILLLIGLASGFFIDHEAARAALAELAARTKGMT